MKPYVELRYVVTCVMARPDHAPDLAAYSFMPNAIASGNQTVFHYDGAYCPFPFAQHQDQHIDCTPFDRTWTEAMSSPPPPPRVSQTSPSFARRLHCLDIRAHTGGLTLSAAHACGSLSPGSPHPLLIPLRTVLYTPTRFTYRAHAHTHDLRRGAANVTPPKNYSDWVNLVTAFAEHIIDRYGLTEVSTWNFEVWNEVRVALLLTHRSNCDEIPDMPPVIAQLRLLERHAGGVLLPVRGDGEGPQGRQLGAPRRRTCHLVRAST